MSDSQKWKRIHSSLGQTVPDPLAEHGGHHQRQDVVQAPGQLDHDDHERHRHACDAPQGGGRPNHRVQAGIDAGLARLAEGFEHVRIHVTSAERETSLGRGQNSAHLGQ